MIKQLLKPGDVVVVLSAGLMIIGSAFLFWTNGEGKMAVVYTDGVEFHRLELDQDTIIEATGPLGPSLIHVHDGKIWIEEAPCPHQLCRKMGKVGRRGGIIVCVPNRILIKIEGESDDWDAVTM